MKKSQFAVPTLKYLGYIICGQGISADKEQIKALQSAPEPNTPEKLKSFLGFAQYYLRFVPCFSDLSNELYQTLNREEFFWNESKSLQELQELTKPFYKLWSTARCYAVSHLVLLLNFSSTLRTRLWAQSSNKMVIQSLAYQENYLLQKLTTVKWKKKYSPYIGHAVVFTSFSSASNSISWLTIGHLNTSFISIPRLAKQSPPCFNVGHWIFPAITILFVIDQIPRFLIDYLSRYAHQEDADPVLFVDRNPVNRNLLIKETKQAYGPVLAGLSRGWSNSARRQFHRLYAQRNDL